MRVQVNNLPKIKLENLLRRRKITMKFFLNELGITTYESLLNKCDRMGVMAPTYEEFIDATSGDVVSNPTEGVVVIEPLPIVKESTGDVIDVDNNAFQLNDVLVENESLDTSNQPIDIDNNRPFALQHTSKKHLKKDKK